MVRGLSMDPGAAHAVPRDDAVVDRELLLGKITQLLRSFDGDLVEAGRRQVPGIESFQWIPREARFVVTVADADDPRHTRRVSVDVLLGESLDLQVTCSCSDRIAGLRCAHGYAALYHLYAELSSSHAEYRVEPGSIRDADPSAWHSRLATLDRLIGDERGTTRTSILPARDVRLSWRVELHPGKQLDVEVAPFEHRRTGTGWTKGRRVPWARLLELPELRTTPADESVARLLADTSRLAGPAGDAFVHLEPFDVLEQLHGHPRVVWARDPSQKLTVERGRLAVSLRLHEGGRLGLVPTLDGRELGSSRTWRLFRRGLLSFEVDTRRLVVARAEASRLSFLEHLLEERPTFPVEARREVLSRLPAMEAIFPVQIPEELETRRVAADDRVHVLLSPVGNGGLSISLRSRPLPRGTYWPPGEGPQEYGRLIDDEWVCAVRRLRREKRRARSLISELLETLASVHPDESLPEIEEPDELGWTWELSKNELALSFLAALQRGTSVECVVEWPDGGARRVLGSPLGLGSLRVQVTDKRDLFGIDGFVAIEETRVALALLLDRARDGRRWVQVDDDRWAEISDELRSRLTAIDDVAHTCPSGLEVGPTALPVVERALEGSDSFTRTAAWKRLAARFASSEEICPEVPAGLQATLRPYQVEGFRWMARLAHWGVGACLADDMGLGKTVQTLAILLHRAEEGPTLVVAPTSVTSNWARESERFAPGLRPILYRDTDRSTVLDGLEPGDVVVASYGLLRRDIERLAEVEWGTVVLDEAQSIKNSRSQTSKSIRTLRSGWRLALTGTPIENHLGELWSLFRFLSPGLFGGWEEFKRDFAEPIEKDGDVERRDALSRVTRPFILRRKKSEVLDELPPRTDIRLTATLSAAERSLYEDARLTTIAYLKGKDIKRHKDVRFQVLAALTRLRQLACHPKLVIPELSISSAKMELFLETVETLREEGHRALVFSQFTSHLALLREALEERGFSFQYLDGQTPPKERARRVDAFQSGEGDLFLISLMAGGTGLNLTAADYVIHMDPWWNPAIEDQATDRAHRMGQKRPVTVYRMVAEDTIEEEIQRMQADKRDLISNVLEGTDRAAKLSTEELIELITER